MSSLSSISAASIAGPALARAKDASDMAAASMNGTGSAFKAKSTQPTAAEVKKAAGQFEAIILRQLLTPSIEPIMNGGLGAGGESGGAGGGGGGVYSYLLTDTLANSLTAGGGLGLGRMLERQLSNPATASAPEAEPESPTP